MNRETQYQQAAFALPSPSETPELTETKHAPPERPTAQFYASASSNR